MKDKLYSDLCLRFGIKETAYVRRELTAKYKHIPSYIELFTVLALREGYKPAPPEEAKT